MREQGRPAEVAKVGFANAPVAARPQAGPHKLMPIGKARDLVEAQPSKAPSDRRQTALQMRKEGQIPAVSVARLRGLRIVRNQISAQRAQGAVDHAVGNPMDTTGAQRVRRQQLPGKKEVHRRWRGKYNMLNTRRPALNLGNGFTPTSGIASAETNTAGTATHNSATQLIAHNGQGGH